MSIKLRKGEEAAIRRSLVGQFNALLESLVTSEFHATQTGLPADMSTDPPSESLLSIEAADASDLATAITLVNQEWSYINSHFADTLAHDSAVTAAMTSATATDLATAITRANEVKADYNTHRTEASVHFNNDATNVVAAADASDLGTLQTLVNEIKVDANAHFAGAFAIAMIELGEA
jgi:hypothetical protein